MPHDLYGIISAVWHSSSHEALTQDASDESIDHQADENHLEIANLLNESYTASYDNRLEGFVEALAARDAVCENCASARLNHMLPMYHQMKMASVPLTRPSFFRSFVLSADRR